MKRSRIITTLGVVIAAAVVITGTTGSAIPPVPAPESTQVHITTDVIDASTSIVTVDIPESSGLAGTTEVVVVDALPEEITVDVADTDGQTISDTVIVEDITVTSAENFVATIRSLTTGESTIIDTAKAQQQIAPIIIALVGLGIKAALKIGTKAAIKEAAKKSLLALNKDKWNHVIASKHNWSRLAKNKDEIANLMADAMANGTRSTGRNHVDFTWSHRGQTIVVRTSPDGHISNGWIK